MHCCGYTCGYNPFGVFDGDYNGADSHLSKKKKDTSGKHKKKKKKKINESLSSLKKKKKKLSSSESWSSSEEEKKTSDSKSEKSSVEEVVVRETFQSLSTDNYTHKTQEEIDNYVNIWMNKVHPRAAKIWSKEQVVHMLETIANFTGQGDNPIILIDDEEEDKKKDVIWHGDISEKNIPVLMIQKPGQDKPTETYVTRALVFLFASDDTLRRLKAVGKGAFPMTCENFQCINFSHIYTYELIS